MLFYFLNSPATYTSTLTTTEMTKYLTTTTSKTASKMATTTSMIETKGYPRINNNAPLFIFYLNIYTFPSLSLHSTKPMPEWSNMRR